MMEPLLQAFSGLSPDEFATLNPLIEKTILSLDKGGIALQTRE